MACLASFELFLDWFGLISVCEIPLFISYLLAFLSSYFYFINISLQLRCTVYISLMIMIMIIKFLFSFPQKPTLYSFLFQSSIYYLSLSQKPVGFSEYLKAWWIYGKKAEHDDEKMNG